MAEKSISRPTAGNRFPPRKIRIGKILTSRQMSSAEKRVVQQELQKYIASGTKKKASGHIKTVNSKKPIEFALTINGLTLAEYQAVIVYVKSLREGTKTSNE